MKYRETQVMAGADGALGFLVKHKDILPRTTASAAVPTLQGVVDDFHVAASVQYARARDLTGEVAQQEAMRVALFRDHIAPIVGAARLVADAIPQLQGLNLPKDNLGIARTMAVARGLADIVRPYETALVSDALEAGFIDRLLDAANALETAAKVARAHRAARVHATDALKMLNKRLTVVMGLLHRLVCSDLSKDSPALAEWKSWRRVLTNRSAKPSETSETSAGSGDEGETPANPTGEVTTPGT